jgi:hypothetical protein
MSGEDLLKVSREGDLKEVNRLLLEGADVNHENNVWDIYDIIVRYAYYIYCNNYLIL